MGRMRESGCGFFGRVQSEGYMRVCRVGSIGGGDQGSVDCDKVGRII